MEKKLKFFFDKNDVIIRIDPKTKKIVGFTILNFEKRFEHRARSETLPITAAFGQTEDVEAEG